MGCQCPHRNIWSRPAFGSRAFRVMTSHPHGWTLSDEWRNSEQIGMVAMWPPLASVVSGMGVHRMPALMNHRPVLETNYYGNITSEQAACRKTIDASRKCLSYLERMHGSRLSRRGVCAMCRSWRYGRDFVLFNYSARCPSSCTADEPTSQVQVRERLLQLLQDCSAAAARGSCLK